MEEDISNYSPIVMFRGTPCSLISSLKSAYYVKWVCAHCTMTVHMKMNVHMKIKTWVLKVVFPFHIVVARVSSKIHHKIKIKKTTLVPNVSGSSWSLNKIKLLCRLLDRMYRSNFKYLLSSVSDSQWHPEKTIKNAGDFHCFSLQIHYFLKSDVEISIAETMDEIVKTF